jgi:hypothetical protein
MMHASSTSKGAEPSLFASTEHASKAKDSLHVVSYYRQLQAGAHPCGSLLWFFDKIALLYWHNLI